MDENRVKHLEMIQAVVARQAGNSFAVKGWSLLIVSALFALAAKDSERSYALLAILPTVCFWGLDAYYLRQERLFRALYDKVRGEKEPASFSMKTTDVSANVKNWLCTIFALVVLPFHGTILVAAVAVWVFFSHAGTA